MPTIIQDLPFFARSTSVELRGQQVPVKTDQIIVWVSIAERGLSHLHPDAPRLPAILDTGCNHGFVIRQQHLAEWSGIDPQYLRSLAKTRVYGKVVPQLAANIWLHPTVPGQRDQFANRPPHRLEIFPGIAVMPEGESDPRLPLLGLRVVRWNGLRVSLKGDRRQVTIRTRPRFWIFG